MEIRIIGPTSRPRLHAPDTKATKSTKITELFVVFVFFVVFVPERQAVGRFYALCRMSVPMTSASRPLRANVLMASAGVLTIGSPRRLNEVFITTGTPVA